MFKRILIAGAALALVVFLAVLVISPLRQRAVSLVNTLRSEVFYFFNPPAEEVFVPETMVEAVVQATLTAMVTPTSAPTLAETVAPTATPEPTPTRPPVPDEVLLTGARHEYQQWNNCGPATLSVALSYWGWKGDQRNTAGWIKPNPRDKNTSPDEMVDYIRSETNFAALMRPGGDLETLKQLVTAGFPVIIERGFDGYDDEGWMGHYELVTGYRDDRQALITQDVLIMPDFPLPYAELDAYWPAFNNTLIVVYPPDREPEVLRALGPLAKTEDAYQVALQQAQAAAETESGRQKFFALFNAGTNLLSLGRGPEAALAYDQAFALYAEMAEDERPWRMVWYQHGPYDAYFQVGRYQDVINLADHTLSRTGEPALEESFFWRARAHTALEDREAAREDLLAALKWHPGWQPAQLELDSLGGP